MVTPSVFCLDDLKQCAMDAKLKRKTRHRRMTTTKSQNTENCHVSTLWLPCHKWVWVALIVAPLIWYFLNAIRIFDKKNKKIFDENLNVFYLCSSNGPEICPQRELNLGQKQPIFKRACLVSHENVEMPSDCNPNDVDDVWKWSFSCVATKNRRKHRNWAIAKIWQTESYNRNTFYNIMWHLLQKLPNLNIWKKSV